MHIRVAALALLLSTEAEAQTRFMNLSAETVGGRCVITKSGGIYVFHADGGYEAKTISGRYQSARWEVAFGKVIRITFKGGDTADFSSSIVDGEARVGIVSKRGSRTYAVADIQPEGSAACDVLAAGAKKRRSGAAVRLSRVERRVLSFQ
jgi:hypothetical protein